MVADNPTAAAAHSAEQVRAGQQRATWLLEQAAAEEHEEVEQRMTAEALALRRQLCHPMSSALYEVEGRALTLALARGDLESARGSCAAAVRWLEMVLGNATPHHPLLALQRFTLADLELACGDRPAALRAMEACTTAIALTAATRSPLRLQAEARLAEMRAEAAVETS
mmetsp:Transcript_26027/g.52177  ORF Transcript_26027/g.52177 Transcript_26027/m.52177 type:complete len:169 (-) Transcript_26027:179-685(-)